ncbi:T9SS type A sorting domain-containing protein [candidate division WOR-3 bacterium]|uniref:T9SS type A sorting domain-containing protein n=1 Tax=candidate division WOR-3 bacterium TaxID=2052148 RepID=A0A9D5K7Q9_UNCW3|nr:T9SS type A sorting domain-containing protein [candidate division WOR-3 bacterium]MBD3363654.1 T9SS type A sorting domain-containing protein [candidate division WOR-3 bacterium]
MSFSVLSLILSAGVLVEPFPLAQSEPGHHQVCLRAAMAADGHFAVAWVDSLQLPDRYELDIFIRFFDKSGSALTEPYKLNKLADTNWVYWPCLDMDAAGNAFLIWEERTDTREDFSDIRFQCFTPDGVPIETAQTLQDSLILQAWRPIGLGLAPGGRFAVTWSETKEEHPGVYNIYVRRYDVDGTPLDTVFLPNEEITKFDFVYFFPNAALNDAGDLVITWLHFKETMKIFPLFQVFDPEDTSILGWEPMGHRVDDGDYGHNVTRSFPFWLDDCRFVVFWWDAPPEGLLGRVFSDRGTTRNPIREVLHHEPFAMSLGDPKATFSIDVSSDERFVYTYARNLYHGDDYMHPWVHHVGILGEIADDMPERKTSIFEYSHPWDEDTVTYLNTQPPAVSVNNDQIVWVYSRLNIDTIYEAWVTITDWDMGEGIVEEPLVNVSPVKLFSTLNRLSYEVPGEAVLTLYNSAGRRVAEDVIHGKGEWQAVNIPSGVYFARVENTQGSARAKVVIVR